MTTSSGSVPYHIPVMADEAISLLEIDAAGTYVDLTFGGGGHSRRILSALGPQGRLYAFDQDRDTEANIPDDGRLHYVQSNFRFMRGALRLRGVRQVDGILADLGVSSHHFDDAARGFSFRSDGPLDMRMNRRGGRTAADVVNGYDTDTLARVLRDWGELETTWKIAACIDRSRRTEPILTTRQLVEVVEPCTPRKDGAKFLTKLFQAAGGYLVPLARGPSGQELHAQRQFRGARRERLLRTSANTLRGGDTQGRGSVRDRDRGQPALAVGTYARRRKTLSLCAESRERKERVIAADGN